MVPAATAMPRLDELVKGTLRIGEALRRRRFQLGIVGSLNARQALNVRVGCDTVITIKCCSFASVVSFAASRWILLVRSPQSGIDLALRRRCGNVVEEVLNVGSSNGGLEGSRLRQEGFHLLGFLQLLSQFRTTSIGWNDSIVLNLLGRHRFCQRLLGRGKR